MKVQTIEEAGRKVRELFNDGLNGSIYFVLMLENKEYQIRVSNHSANAQNNINNYDGVFSFISSWNNQKCNMHNEWMLDDGGHFLEEFTSVEDCLEFNI